MEVSSNLGSEQTVPWEPRSSPAPYSPSPTHRVYHIRITNLPSREGDGQGSNPPPTRQVFFSLAQSASYGGMPVGENNRVNF